MNIPFHKYQGTGNDFIMIDERDFIYSLEEEKIAFLCDRHFGIGADGLIRIRRSEQADFEMVYYNSDGKIGSMCGNGGRCAVAFAYDLKHIGRTTAFLASDGLHQAEIISEKPFSVKLKMKDVNHVELVGSDFFIDTGSPHLIKIVDEPEEIDVVKEGRKIRNHEHFKAAGTNVNFVKAENGGVRLRTYERGVEDETLSCGTGIVGSVLVLVHAKKLPSISPVSVRTKGGQLNVYFDQTDNFFRNVFLEGPATFVFTGNI